MTRSDFPEDTTEPTFKKGPFERVAGFKEAILLLAGFAYVFGYLSRALHAFNNNLGALPGVRFEYLVAGGLLLIPPIAFCAGLWGVWRSAKRLAGWAAKTSERKTRVTRVLSLGFLLGAVVVVLPDSLKTAWMFVFVGWFFYYILYFAAGGEFPEFSDETTESTASVGFWGKVRSFVGHVALYLWGALVAFGMGLLLIAAFVLAVFYGAIAVQHVPQEFGGVQPKWGVIDLSSEELSAELRNLITNPDEHLDPSSKVVRSKPLEVFSTSEPWLVRVPSKAPTERPRSIRLDAKAVLSVEWCH
jgi:hypothetical protein